MVKFLGESDGELVFNYLSTDRSALLSCVTEYYPKSYLENGVFAMQYVDETPVSLCAFGDSFSLLFSSDKTDFEEFSFALNNKIHSPDFLPFYKVGEYYLLKKSVLPNSDFSLENNGIYEDFKSVLSLNQSEETVRLQYLFKKGCVLPFVLSENGTKIGVGLIINSENYSVISHVFVKQEFRGKGFGRSIVNNLLRLCKTEKIYLISEKTNLEFYGKLGFAPVLTVNKYDTK
ncbi:MAG: GNAT family N-acetyltransferase [Oscillospiraceae bacterium]|nr:GNAT family N-acetyltransferase [Oscillospiraceae bacterium]